MDATAMVITEPAPSSPSSISSRPSRRSSSSPPASASQRAEPAALTSTRRTLAIPRRPADRTTPFPTRRIPTAAALHLALSRPLLPLQALPMSPPGTRCIGGQAHRSPGRARHLLRSTSSPPPDSWPSSPPYPSDRRRPPSSAHPGRSDPDRPIVFSTASAPATRTLRCPPRRPPVRGLRGRGWDGRPFMMRGRG